MSDLHRRHGVHLLVTITSPEDVAKIEHMLEHAGFSIQYSFRGEGTAGSDTMELLGVTGHDRALTISILPSFVIRRALWALSTHLDLHRPGHGIAFTIPVSGISSFIRRHLDAHASASGAQHIGSEAENMHESSEYSLIIVAVNQGYDEDVMATARELGVMGGTVIHALGFELRERMKFWGISVQSEKELIAIVAEKRKRLELMRAIGEKYGSHSKALGIVFSLPVDGIAGMEQAPVL